MKIEAPIPPHKYRQAEWRRFQWSSCQERQANDLSALGACQSALLTPLGLGPSLADPRTFSGRSHRCAVAHVRPGRTASQVELGVHSQSHTRMAFEAYSLRFFPLNGGYGWKVLSHGGLLRSGAS